MDAAETWKSSDNSPMNGGDGIYSYTRNSAPQGEAASLAKSMLVAAISENLDMEQQLQLTSKTFRIADLGCSVGPNTYTAMKNIIDSIKHKCQIEGNNSHLLPEFQVFFNDHASNDFNTLFTNLPLDREYFAAGVPGSFHGRLFPQASLNFVYSAFALHWLSRVPQELADSNSSAFNKGRIYYTNAPRQVGEAYAAQYAKDMGSFLDARAQELASGGLMTLLIPARPDGTTPVQCSLGPIFQPLESCLVDMANEGVISEAKVDSFNLPIYSPSLEELIKLIQRNGCFRIAKLEPLPQRPNVPLLTPAECRAGMEGTIEKHFGKKIIEQLFDRYAKKIAGCPALSADDGFAIGLFVLLERCN